MASSSAGAPEDAQQEAAPRSNVRVVAHDHRTHDAPIEVDEGFDAIPVESLLRMSYDIKQGLWKEDRVDIKLEGRHLGQGGLKNVQRAFRRAEGSIADDGGKTGATESGIRADWVAIVLKEYFGGILDALSGREGVIEQFRRDVCMQWEAKALAIVFNASNPPKKIEVLEPVILLRDSGEVYFSEPFMVGTFFKHNDPAANILGMQEGFADDHNYIRMTPQAFSHFSWHHTGGQKLVMDVQGVGDVYTDPQIITAEGGRYGFGGLDSGTTGLIHFACSHVCNPICEELGLSPFHLSPREVDRIALLWDDMKKDRPELGYTGKRPEKKPIEDFHVSGPQRSNTWHSVMRRRHFRGAVGAVIAMNRFRSRDYGSGPSSAKLPKTDLEVVSEPALGPEPEAELQPEPEPELLLGPKPTLALDLEPEPTMALVLAPAPSPAPDRAQQPVFRAPSVLKVPRSPGASPRALAEPPRSPSSAGGAMHRTGSFNNLGATGHSARASHFGQGIDQWIVPSDKAGRRSLEASPRDKLISPRAVSLSTARTASITSASSRSPARKKLLSFKGDDAESQGQQDSQGHTGSTPTAAARGSPGGMQLALQLAEDATEHEEAEGPKGDSSTFSNRTVGRTGSWWTDTPRSDPVMTQQWAAKAADGKQVDNLFDLFKHICQTRPADPGVWEQHGRLHARFWLYYHTNTHPYYHREGLWLSPQERATDGCLHLCYAVAMMRALKDSLGSKRADAEGLGPRDSSRLSVQESRRQVQARLTLLLRIEAARARADAVPIVMHYADAIHDHSRICYADTVPHTNPAVRRWSAARDIATAIFLWCDTAAADPDSISVLGVARERRETKSRKKHRAYESAQLLGGPRRFQLIRTRPDGLKEAFAAVATADEAVRLCPDYMRDRGFKMGAAFSREADEYRFGDGGAVVGWQKMTRADTRHWASKTVDVIQRVIAEGEASACESAMGSCPMDEWIEAARRRLVERSMGGEVDGAGAEELEARIEAHAPSARAFKQPVELPSSRSKSGGACVCGSRPRKVIRPPRDEF